ncbi:potassium-transporting ATPase subunit KdpC [Bordetella sp. BOR01]|uniref:potassium-transporting ATPase subunit KdpC n=1 Tax=Bordetella sp. BOR01 TaxID=2854779 RepID=UPI001C44616A|nr:potassium-transporting ATPase subunit KdpC [Bordetella sp. BOR01]MBV7482858.1 potassium-transporting ATPase subunit KdpC [Bordetella sp. BOR01]
MTTATSGNLRARPATQASVFDQGVLRGAIGLTALSLIGFGFLYSLAGVGIGQALFPYAANGSVLERGGRVVGSELVAQPFSGDKYFHPRPSAAGYNPMALAGSNQARTNPDLRKRVDEARAEVAQREGVDPAAVPGDLVTQSGSGIDPHITPAGAALQAERVARARGLGRDVVDQLVAEQTQGLQFGVFGQPRVHVLNLNLALDELAARAQPGAIRAGAGK